jgi:DNA repair protein SbcC/Rad50
MRPVQLALHAFGPYAAQQVLDFRQLGDRTFFLVHGPTGAGKTTILDAMCFALYGETSGGERDARHMRSDFAEPTIPTEVTFDFALGTEVYRVTRSPQQERPKRRGAGTTTIAPQATLWRRTGLAGNAQEGSVLASQWGKVTEAIERLLGFRSDQFRQVVMLPQGQFRRLLLANSQERQQIFETLFRTEIYRHIEEALKEAAKAVAEEIKDRRRRRDLLLEQASAESSEELLERRTQLEAHVANLHAHVEELRQLEATAQQRLTAGYQVVQKIRERDEAEAALQALENRQEAFAAGQIVLDRARKAVMLLDAERELSRSTTEAEEAQQRLMDARAALAEARAAIEQAEQTFAQQQAREHEREDTRQYLGRLEELTAKVQELEQATEMLAAAEREVSQLGHERQALQSALEECQRTIEEKFNALTEAQRVAAHVDVYRMALQEAQRLGQQRQQLVALQKQLSLAHQQLHRVRGRLVEAEDSFSRARQTLQAVETAWLAGQAAILAQQLIPGVPCPVCGSTEHSSPARSDHKLPSEAALKKMRAEVERLEAARDALRKAEAEQATLVIQLESNERAVLELLGDYHHQEVAVLESRIQAAQASLALAVRAQAQVAILTEEVQRLKGGEAQTRQRLTAVEAHLHDASGRRAAAQAVLEERASGLPEHVRDLTSLIQSKAEAEARLQALKEAFEAAQQEVNRARERMVACETVLHSTAEAADKTQRHVDALRVDFDKRLQMAGFANEASFQGAKRSPAEIDHLEEAIRRFEGELRSARDRFERACQAAALLVPPDIQTLEHASKQAKADLETALKAETILVGQLQQIDAWLHDLRDTARALQALEVQYTVSGRIAEVANGHNTHGITFQRFVLAALLDDVLVAASERLRTMSRRRFSLQRATARADRRMAGGLDLEVYDTYTGTTRAVSTLSGGESFLASLALALGLADVVQAYAGGIRLDTIFVDEGFGSLDPEALDLAFRALVDLQQGGRLVGIISHVPELKERIDVRLEVIPAQRGSVTRFVIL